MKQKTLTTDKATLLVAEMPEDNIFSAEKQIQAFIDSQNWIMSLLSRDSDSNCKLKLLGRIPDITEDDASKIVDEYIYNTGEIDGYYDYENDTQTDCPIESLNSLMYANEIYFENPYQYPGLIPSAELDLYRQAQCKVWDKERTYLLIKVD